MFEKVNPDHPDKVADRIAGALVDYAYSVQEDPRIAVEVLLGHGLCTILAESSVDITVPVATEIVHRIAGDKMDVIVRSVPQDAHLAANQEGGIRCGDNGIFKGSPITAEQRLLTDVARACYQMIPHDGKYVLDAGELTICQSKLEHCDELDFNQELLRLVPGARKCSPYINPIGPWTGGPDVDSGATNRKLGSDMGDGVTGGGLHGKDLSKADVAVNVYAHIKAQLTGRPVCLSCSIGDKVVDGIPYEEIVKVAKLFIRSLGGFEKFAEWGLIR